MALRIRFQYPTGASLGFSIERLSDGLLFDFSNSTFRQSPLTAIENLPEDSGIFVGRYRANFEPTPPSQFIDGDYLITIHNRCASNIVLAQLTATMRSGDDATQSPGGGTDPWSTSLPGNYPNGTAGAILGQYLDAKVSSRSTFDGGIIEGVRSPVIVGSNLDKGNYSLGTSGLDSIVVENGINLRQAIAPILAAAAGQLSGAGTGSIVIKAAGGVVTRITATTDNAGNRSSIDLNLPA